MGVDGPAVIWLFASKAKGVDFSELATLGRQGFFPDRRTLQWALDRQARGIDGARLLRESHGYAEPFFDILGTKRLTAFDRSDYEGASVLHDFNTPIPKSFEARFSAVLDVGTIEHVFNVPETIRNCLAMVKVGGHFVQVTAGNNFIGHGFYQFSPEFIYRVFSPENGFVVEHLVLHEMLGRGRWYRVPDSIATGHRVELTSRAPTYLMSVARKTAHVPVFASWPQQRDYTVAWQGRTGEGLAPAARASLRSWIPQNVVRALRSLGGPGVNSAVTRLTREAVITGRF